MALEAKRVVVPKEPVAMPAVLNLPVQILTAADISRLQREVENFETFFEEAAIRGGATVKTVPQPSILLAVLLKDNNLNILHKEDRLKLLEFLAVTLKKAPIVHVSFATDPRPDFLMRLMQWFRKEAHPLVLFKVGLQPTLGAGCVVRTPNKYFDLSFKKHFADSRAKLGDALRAIK